MGTTAITCNGDSAAAAPRPKSYSFWSTLCILFVLSALQALYNLYKDPSYSGEMSIIRTETTGETETVRALDYPLSVKEVVINIGSNHDPIMPPASAGPCARGIAFEPIVGCIIPEHPQLDVVHAAVSSASGFTSMRVYNTLGQSSSLAEPASKQFWNENRARGDGRLVLVPVVAMTSILDAVPQNTSISLLMTDMQGYDFEAVSSAGGLLKARVKHLITEVWLDDVYSYNANNDLCRDWLPFMTELGYQVKRLWDGDMNEDISKIPERCQSQLEHMPVRPAVNASAGLNEMNVHWVRLDSINERLPRISYPKNAKRFTKEEYAKCQDPSFVWRKNAAKSMAVSMAGRSSSARGNLLKRARVIRVH